MLHHRHNVAGDGGGHAAVHLLRVPARQHPGQRPRLARHHLWLHPCHLLQARPALPGLSPDEALFMHHTFQSNCPPNAQQLICLPHAAPLLMAVSLAQQVWAAAAGSLLLVKTPGCSLAFEAHPCPAGSSHAVLQLSATTSLAPSQISACKSTVLKVTGAPHVVLKRALCGGWCRAYDLPFQRHMGLPYSDFVLNIQPDDYQQLNDKIQFFLENPARLRHMQVPQPFTWHKLWLIWNHIPVQQHHLSFTLSRGEAYVAMATITAGGKSTSHARFFLCSQRLA